MQQHQKHENQVFGALRRTTIAALFAGGLLYGTAACTAESGGGEGGDAPADTGGEKSCGEHSCGESGHDHGDEGGEKSCGEKSCGEKSCGEGDGGEKSCGEKDGGERTCGG